MDEDEIAFYEAMVFRLDAHKEHPIYEQLGDERGLVPGCYRTKPAKHDE